MHNSNTHILYGKMVHKKTFICLKIYRGNMNNPEMYE